LGYCADFVSISKQGKMLLLVQLENVLDWAV